MLMLINAVPLVTSSIWLPLLLLFYKRSLENENKKEIYYALISTLVMAVSHFAGYIQISLIYSGLFLGGFCVYFCVSNGYDIRKILRKLFILFFIAIVSVLIYSVQLFPTLDLLSYSNRSEILFSDSMFYGAVKPSQSLDILLPNVFRYFDNNILVNTQVSFMYFGIIPLMLFLIGVMYAQNKWRYFFLITFFVFLFASFGGFTSLYEYFVVFIPKLDAFRNVNKILYLSAFSLSLVAGMGADYLLQKGKDLELKRFLSLFFVGASFLVIIQLANLFLIFNDGLKKTLAENIADSIIILLMQILMASLLFFYFAKSGNKKIFIFFVVCIVFFDLANFNSRTLPNNIHIDPHYYLEANNEKCTVCRAENSGDFGRVIFAGGTYGPHYAPSVGNIFNAGGYCSFILENSLEMFNNIHAADKSNHKFSERMAKLGVKYVVSSEEIKNNNLTLIDERVINKKNQKYFFDYGGDTTGIKNKDLGRSEFLYMNNEFNGIISTDASYKIEEFDSDRMRIKFHSDQGDKVVIRTQYYPGWKAYVNNKEVPCKHNSNGFIVFSVDSGDSVVELFFMEKKFPLGVMISVISLVLVVFLMIKFRKDNEKK